MSSVASIVKELSGQLPIAILNVEWNDPVLVVGGAGWSLAITSPWRVVTTERLVLGSDNAGQDSLERVLKDRMVVSCGMQSRHASLDLALIFESGEALEVFSVAYLEPWILSLSNSGVFVPSPSE